MSKKFDVTITYLEQTERSYNQGPPKPHGKTALMRSEKPPVHFYRYLFDQVGAAYHWVSRRYMSDEELIKHIHDPDVYIYVMYVDGSPCGMGEIEARHLAYDQNTVELKFFGLMEFVQGRKLSRWFLHNVVELAWALSPERVVLETCTADHPAALPLYQKMGFSVFDQGKGTIEWRG